MTLSPSSQASPHLCPESNQFRELVDALPAIAWRADAQTRRFTFVSEAAESVLGYPAQQWLEDAAIWPGRVHADDRQVIQWSEEETLAGRNHEVMFRMHSADGRVVWLHNHVTIRLENGQPSGFFGVMLDVTARIEAQKALQRSDEQHRRMLETLPDGFGVHVRGRLVYVNREFMRILGANSPSELIGRAVLDFVHPDDKALVLKRQSELSVGRDVPLVEERLIRLDGETVHVEVAATPVVYDGVPSVQVVVRDIGARTEVERDLRELDERLRILKTGTNEAIWEWNLLTGELWANRAHHDLFMPAGREASYNDWVERLHPADRERVVKRSEHAVATVSSWSDEYRFRRPDGSYGRVLDRGRVVAGPDGRAARMIGEMTDVTALRTAEQQRLSAETKFRSVVENSLVGTYMIRDGRFVYINATGAAMFGWDVADILAMPDAAALVAKQDRSRVATLFHPLPGQPSAGRVSAECIHRGGKRIAVEFFGTASTIDGEFCVIGTMLDITAHREAREELQRSEQRYRDLVEEVQDVIYSVDTEGRITSLNSAFERLTGYSRDEWLGRSFTGLFEPASIPPAVDQFRRTLKGNQVGDPDTVRAYKLRAKSGEILDIEASGQAKAVDGTIVGAVGIVRDVTLRRLLERKLEESKRLDSLGQLAASIAHEFNNVLMSIQPFAEVISRKTSGDETVANACKHIHQAVGRGKRVSQQILRFANHKESELSSIEIRSWLDDALAHGAGGIPPEIMVVRMIDPACHTVLADRNQLDQVFVNLLFNARDAMTRGGSIVVKIGPADLRRLRLTLPDGEYVCISVIDSGTGIAPDVLPKIFDPLFTTKRNGTGLGLSIARKLIEAQGGAITVESALGAGTSFHVVLPRGAALQNRSVVSSRDSRDVRRVVLVEDDAAVAEGTIAILQVEGVQSRHVAEGRAAEAAIDEFNPDAVVIDLNLEDMNGLDVCAMVERRWPDLPVVIATGHVESQLDTRLVTLMKPYAVHELLEAIRTARSRIIDIEVGAGAQSSSSSGSGSEIDESSR